VAHRVAIGSATWSTSLPGKGAVHGQRKTRRGDAVRDRNSERPTRVAGGSCRSGGSAAGSRDRPHLRSARRLITSSRATSPMTRTVYWCCSVPSSGTTRLNGTPGCQCHRPVAEAHPATCTGGAGGRRTELLHPTWLPPRGGPRRSSLDQVILSSSKLTMCQGSGTSTLSCTASRSPEG
jgi:hypothetical protein